MTINTERMPPTGHVVPTFKRRSFFEVMVGFSVRLMERWMPDALIFAFILTLIVAACSVAFMGSSPLEVAGYWGDSIWNLLSFSMQMALIVVTGFILATTPLVRRILASAAGLAKTPSQAILLVSVVALTASWINWGFGLVVGALFARQLAQRVHNVDYRLLIASAYSGWIVFHGGLSGSVPLLIATEGHFTQDLIGVISTSQTLFSPFNLLIVGALFVAVPLVNWMMVGRHGETVTVDPAKLAREDEVKDEPVPNTLAGRLDNSVIISMAIGLLGLTYLALHFFVKGGGLNINTLNLIFLITGIILHGTPRRLLGALQESVKGVSPIIIQFPFYAGIMGIMQGSGLSAALSGMFVAMSTADTLPLFSFYSAGLLNIFIPSGGGQWAVQGPIMMEAAKNLGADIPQVAMAVAWGDAWTNLIQPFWALPALAIAGLRAKDIMGFCLILLLVSGVIISTGIYLG